MKIHVFGGDERFACLAQELQTYGTAEGNAYIFGNGQQIKEEMRIKPEDLLMVFSPHPIEGKDRTINLLEEEEFLVENAWLTAEGAIVSAAGKVDFALRGCECLVVGFGRIGQALTDLLVGIGAKPTVFSRREKARNRAMERGAHAVEKLEEGLRGVKIIFSTPAEMMLNEEMLRCTAEDAIILDLASAPYGVDLAAAERLQRKAWQESGVPGRYCPKSAAHALIKAVKIVIDRERSGEK